MTQNLTLALSAGAKVLAASNTSRTEVEFTPTSCGTNGACAMNGNTRAGNGTYYYSWYAATAGSGTSSDVDVDTPSSICPIGWRLPANYTIDPDKSYGSITDAYDMTENGVNNFSQGYISILESFPFNYLRLGYYRNGSSYYNGISGYYFSSTAGTSTSYAYYFDYYTSYTAPQREYNKYDGYNVRCVAL